MMLSTTPEDPQSSTLSSRPGAADVMAVAMRNPSSRVRSSGLAPGRATGSAPLSTGSPKRSRLAEVMAQRFAQESAPAQIAHWITLMFEDLDAALVPLLGPHGVVAAYQRGLHLAAAAHPWLVSSRDRAPDGMDLAHLASVLGQQSSGNAAAGGCALLQMVRDVLASVIGAALTERLLHPVWERFCGGPARLNRGTAAPDTTWHRLTSELPGLDEGPLGQTPD